MIKYKNDKQGAHNDTGASNYTIALERKLGLAERPHWLKCRFIRGRAMSGAIINVSVFADFS